MSNLLTSESTAFIVIAKKSFRPLYDENDELIISNSAAIRKGLEALNKEDASDRARAEELWADAIDRVRKESDNENSPSAQGTMSVVDDYSMEDIAIGL